MERKMFFLSMFAMIVGITSSLSAEIVVDFSGLTSSVDITTANNPNGLMLNGLTMKYDNFTINSEFGQADSSGLYGTTYGVLIFEFNLPATELEFEFSILAVPSTFENPLFLNLQYNGFDVANENISAEFSPYDPQHPDMGDALGSVEYSNGTFDTAYMYFTTDGPNFTVSNISYEVLPEPATLILMIFSFVWFNLRHRG